MHQRSPRGNLVLLFAHVIIRNGGALRDVAHAPDDASAREHRLAECRFARRRVTTKAKFRRSPAEGVAITQTRSCYKHASNSPRTQAQSQARCAALDEQTERPKRAEGNHTRELQIIFSARCPQPMRQSKSGYSLPSRFRWPLHLLRFGATDQTRLLVFSASPRRRL
jgi:hypothetical protein